MAWAGHLRGRDTFGDVGAPHLTCFCPSEHTRAPCHCGTLPQTPLAGELCPLSGVPSEGADVHGAPGAAWSPGSLTSRAAPRRSPGVRPPAPERPPPPPRAQAPPSRGLGPHEPDGKPGVVRRELIKDTFPGRERAQPTGADGRPRGPPMLSVWRHAAAGQNKPGKCDIRTLSPTHPASRPGQWLLSRLYK